jgi:hypothetical protein
MKIAHSQKIVLALAAASSLAAGSAAYASNTDSQTVNFTINNISEIDVASGPIGLTVNTATAGSQPNVATAPSSYSITTNASDNGKKITVALDSDMPTNTTLTVEVAAPTASGTSAGAVTLSATAADVVTGLQGAAQSNVAITYTLNAPVTVKAQSDSRTVTYTIVDL